MDSLLAREFADLSRRELAHCTSVEQLLRDVTLELGRIRLTLELQEHQAETRLWQALLGFAAVGTTLTIFLAILLSHK